MPWKSSGYSSISDLRIDPNSWADIPVIATVQTFRRAVSAESIDAPSMRANALRSRGQPNHF